MNKSLVFSQNCMSMKGEEGEGREEPDFNSPNGEEIVDDEPDQDHLVEELEEDPSQPKGDEWKREYPSKADPQGFTSFRNYLLDEIGFNSKRGKIDILGNLYFEDQGGEIEVTYEFDEDILETVPEVQRPLLADSGPEVQEQAIRDASFLSSVEVQDGEQNYLEVRFGVDKDYAMASAEELAELIPQIEEDFGFTRYATPDDNY